MRILHAGDPLDRRRFRGRRGLDRRGLRQRWRLAQDRDQVVEQSLGLGRGAGDRRQHRRLADLRRLDALNRLGIDLRGDDDPRRLDLAAPRPFAEIRFNSGGQLGLCADRQRRQLRWHSRSRAGRQWRAGRKIEREHHVDDPDGNCVGSRLGFRFGGARRKLAQAPRRAVFDRWRLRRRDFAEHPRHPDTLRGCDRLGRVGTDRADFVAIVGQDRAQVAQHLRGLGLDRDLGPIDELCRVRILHAGDPLDRRRFRGRRGLDRRGLRQRWRLAQDRDQVVEQSLGLGRGAGDRRQHRRLADLRRLDALNRLGIDLRGDDDPRRGAHATRLPRVLAGRRVRRLDRGHGDDRCRLAGLRFRRDLERLTLGARLPLAEISGSSGRPAIAWGAVAHERTGRAAQVERAALGLPDQPRRLAAER